MFKLLSFTNVFTTSIPNPLTGGIVYGPVTGTVATILTLPIDAGRETCGASRESPAVQRWLDLARAGDQAAFGCLVEEHRRSVFKAAVAALGQREDAEDVTQDAFLLAWRKLPGFRGDSTFRTWMLTIVWRKALDRRRSRLLWWKRTVAARDAIDPIELVPTPAAGPEHEAVTRDRAAHVRREIARLSPTLRDTLLLAASGEYTYEEIAAMLGRPLGTIKWRVSEARRIVSARIDT